jgi:predicted O-linked N-acetylglucosamine transferase (SPINDLY family)
VARRAGMIQVGIAADIIGRMLWKLRNLFKPEARPSPVSAGHLFRQALDLQSQGELAAAAESLRLIIESHPDHWEALNELASIALQSGELEKAVELYGGVIDRRPQYAEPYYKRGNALNRLGRLEMALADYDRAAAIDPSHARAWCNRGAVLERLGRHADALESFDRAIEQDPLDCLTHYNRGSALKELKRFEEALASYDKAVELKPDFVAAYINRGNVLEELRRHYAAIASFDQAIALEPIHAEAFEGRGVALYMLKRFDQARADYDRAIARKPDSDGFYVNRGNLMLDWQHFEAASADYLKAIQLNPKSADAYQGLGHSLAALKQLERSIASYDQALALDPGQKYLIATRRAAKMQACDWDGLREDFAAIADGVNAGRPVCNPLALAQLADSPALHRVAAEIWIREESPPDAALGPIGPRSLSSKIRVGYFSADFRNHPVAYLAAGMFEHHDRSRFELTAFAFGPEANDAMRARLNSAFDRFIDVRRHSDTEVAALAREIGIDIAVDLNGITKQCRTNIFALRAAPIQINYLGYPCTMGADYMDYLIGDRTVIPRSHQAYYAEKIIYLPDSFMPFDSKYAIADRTFTREEFGLPSEGFVFCCFNNSYKLTPEVFDGWMRVLSRTERSVIWLSQDNATAAGNLLKEASRRGVDPGRLIFADRMPSLPEHVARLRIADLFMDTFPYNAHATALDALWAGLPVLTRAGQGFASRVAASLLHTIGLPELITDSISQYEDLAVALAADPARLAQLRAKLSKQRLTSALFDTERYTRNLEAAYQQIHARYHSGAAPIHVDEPSP